MTSDVEAGAPARRPPASSSTWSAAAGPAPAPTCAGSPASPGPRSPPGSPRSSPAACCSPARSWPPPAAAHRRPGVQPRRRRRAGGRDRPLPHPGRRLRPATARSWSADSVDHEVGTGPDELMPQIVAAGRRPARADRARRCSPSASACPAPSTPSAASASTPPSCRAGTASSSAPYFADLTDAPLVDRQRRRRARPVGAARPRDAALDDAARGQGLDRPRARHRRRRPAGPRPRRRRRRDRPHQGRRPRAGLPCRCGDTGCLETVAGGWALVARRPRGRRASTTSATSSPPALAGDADRPRPAPRERPPASARCSPSPINLLNPQAVVIGGDMAAAFDIVAGGVRESVYAHATALATRDLQFLPRRPRRPRRAGRLRGARARRCSARGRSTAAGHWSRPEIGPSTAGCRHSLLRLTSARGPMRGSARRRSPRRLAGTPRPAARRHPRQRWTWPAGRCGRPG